MKRRIRVVLISRMTTYLAAITATFLVILAGLSLSFDANVLLVFGLISLSALCGCLSWLSFVFRTHNLIRTQAGVKELQALTSQVARMVQDIPETLNGHAERQEREYRNQALNTLIKLEQLRVAKYTDSRGSHDK